MNEKVKTWEKFWSFEDFNGLLPALLFLVREKMWVRKFIKIALKYSSRGKVLEAGSGSAVSSIILSRIRGDEITALDISPTALKIASVYAKKNNVCIETVNRDILNMPFADKSFDLAWNSGTLEHFDNPVEVLSEMLRVGKIIISIIPTRCVAFNLLEKFSKIMPRDISVAFYEGSEKWYSADEWKNILISAGCQRVIVKKIRCLGIFSYLAGMGYSN